MREKIATTAKQYVVKTFKVIFMRYSCTIILKKRFSKAKR